MEIQGSELNMENPGNELRLQHPGRDIGMENQDSDTGIHTPGRDIGMQNRDRDTGIHTPGRDIGMQNRDRDTGIHTTGRDIGMENPGSGAGGMRNSSCDTEMQNPSSNRTNSGKVILFKKAIDSQTTFLQDVWKPKDKVSYTPAYELNDTEEDNINVLCDPSSKGNSKKETEFDNGFDIKTYSCTDDDDTEDEKFHRNISFQPLLVSYLRLHFVSLMADENDTSLDGPRVTTPEYNSTVIKPPPKPPRAHRPTILFGFPMSSQKQRVDFSIENLFERSFNGIPIRSSKSTGEKFIDQERLLTENKNDARKSNEESTVIDNDTPENAEDSKGSSNFDQLINEKATESTINQNDALDNTFCSFVFTSDEQTRDTSVPLAATDSGGLENLETTFDEMSDLEGYDEDYYEDDLYTEDDTFGSLDNTRYPCTCASDKNQGEASMNSFYCIRHAPSRIRQFNKNHKMLQDLSRTEGLEIHDVVPDGNCMFRAIVDQLRMNGELEWTCNQIRQKAVMYLREWPLEKDGTHLKEFLTNEGENWEGYLDRMSKDGEWGDQMILRGLAEVTKKEICIISTIGEFHNQTSIVPINTSTDGKIYLGHVNDQHYYSLRPKGWQCRWYKEARKRKLSQENVDESNQPETKAESHRSVGFSPNESHFIDCGSDYVDGYSKVPVFHLSFIMKNVLKPKFLYTPKQLWKDKFDMTTGPNGFDSVGSVVEDLAVNIYPALSRMTNGTGNTSNNAMKTSLMPNLYRIANSSKVFFPQDRYELNKDVVLVHSSQTHAGYATLEIQKESLEPYRIKFGGKYYIDSSQYLKLSKKQTSVYSKAKKKDGFLFQKDNKICYCYSCPRWPDETAEWFKRKRQSKWPDEDTLNDIRSVPCVLSPASRVCSHQLNIEWVFDFSYAEKLLLTDRITHQQRHCFHIFKLLIDFYTGKRCDLSTFVLKTVFLYSLECVPICQWEKCSSACLLYMLDFLHGCLKDRNIPNYFIPENNIISHVHGDALYFLIERVNVIREFPIMSIIIMAESHGLMSTCITDQVIEDLNNWSDGSVAINSVLTTFVPAYSKLTASALLVQHFREASDAAVSGFELLQDYLRSSGDESNPYQGYTLAHFIKEATENMQLYQTWWLCFFVDLFYKEDTLSSFGASRCLKRVKDFYKDPPSGLLDDVPVPDFVINFSTHHSDQEVPERREFNQTAFLITMYQFLMIEKQYELAAEYIRATVRQLNSSLNNQDGLADDVERRRRFVGGNTDYVLHQRATSISCVLYSILYQLYQCYLYLGHPEYFQEYVEQFETLCNFMSTPDSFRVLADVWKVLGNVEKMKEALDKEKNAGY